MTSILLVKDTCSSWADLASYEELVQASSSFGMKKKKWAVDAEKPIGWIMEFVKKYLKLEADEKLVQYNNIYLFKNILTTHILTARAIPGSNPDCDYN